MARKLPQGMRYKNNRIEYRFRIGDTRYSVYGSTKEECKDNEIKLREQVKAGTYKKTVTLTVSEYLDRWMENRHSIKAATVRTYCKLINRMKRQTIDKAGHTFGSLKLSDLETENIRNLQKSLLNEGLKTRTVNDSVSLLNKALETAVNERIIDWNPAKAVERLKQTEDPARDTIHRSLTREEADTFLKAAVDSWYYPLYVFLLNTGLRIGEASALTLRDVTDGFINVCKTVTRENTVGYVIREQTKTDAGRRTIPTRPEAWKAFQDQRRNNDLLNSQEPKRGILPRSDTAEPL